MHVKALRWRYRTLAVAVAGLLVVGVAAMAAVSAQSAQTHGNAAAGALNTVQRELDASRFAAARHSVAVAEHELAHARAALGSNALEVVGALPLARSYIQDAEQLVAAAAVMAYTGRQIVQLDSMINGAGGFLFWSQQIDLHALRAHAALARAISRQLARARANLDAVTYVPGGGSLLAARQRARSSIDRVAGLVKVLGSPTTVARALGSRQPRRYLVIARNDSAALPSGGEPIATAIVTLRHGEVGVRPGPRPTLRRTWQPVARDSWLVGDGGRHSLADALAAPSFPLAAREAIRWGDASRHGRLDGVVSIDTSGLARFVAVTRPHELQAGVNARTLPTLLSPTTSVAPHEFAARAGRILVAVLQEAVDVRHATDRLDALGNAAAAGDLRVFSRHPSTQSLLVADGLGGELPPVKADEVGVAVAGLAGPVTAETTQLVNLTESHPEVVRTTHITLPASAEVTEFAPTAASAVQLTVDGDRVSGRDFGDVHGRQAVGIRLPAGAHILRLGYQLEAPARPHAGGIYTVTVDGDPGLVGPTTVRVFNGWPGGAPRDSRWSRIPGGYQITFADGGGYVSDLTITSATGFWPWLWGSGGWLIVWLVICGLLAVAGLRRIWIPLGTVLGLYGAVPMAAAHWLTRTGGSSQGVLDCHPATWLVVITAVVFFVARPREVAGVVWRSPANRIVFMLAAGLLADAVVTAVVRHVEGWSQIGLSMLAAPLVALLVLVAVRRHPRSAQRFSLAFLGFALALSGLAMIEALAGRNLLYAADYNKLVWGRAFAQYGFRAATTLDEPLNTGLVLVVALALARRHLQGRLRWAAMVALLLGVVATGSRTGLLIGVTYALWSLVSDRRTSKHSARLTLRRVVAAGVVGMAVLVGVLVTPPGQRFVDRAMADHGSAALRIDGLRAFAPHLPHYLFYGSGVGTGDALTRMWMHSPNSAENPIVLTAVALGVIAALAQVMALLCLSRVRWRQRPSLVQQAFLLAFVTSLGYSSFGTVAISVVVVWLFAGLAAADADYSTDNDTVIARTASADQTPNALPAAPVRLPPRALVPLARCDASAPPAVTAIMAARDAAKTIGVAVTSVLCQSSADWELIVVDDGSEDDTVDVVRSVAAGDQRIRVVRNIGHGRGAARNTALMQARGRYIAICDADDWSRRDRFVTQIDYLDKHPDIGVVGAQVANFGPWGGPEIVYRCPTDPALARARLRRGHAPVPHQAAMVRRELMRRIGGYDTECVRAQDLELFLRLEALTEMTNLDDVLVDYRHSRRTSLPYWLDNGRWRRFAIARAQAATAAAPPPDAASFHRRPAAFLATAYDVASYARTRYVLSRRGVRSL
jgi:hypothetical protein